MKRVTTILLFGVLGLLASDALAASVGKAFTYQGTLRKSHAAVAATCEFRFSLYDSLVGGNQIGTTQTSSLAVSGGLFTATLNEGGQFGSPFTGYAEFLAIQVKCPPDAAFVALTPRQRLNAVPYAMGPSLPFSTNYGTLGDVFYIRNAGSGRAIQAVSEDDTAVWAISNGGIAGVDARNTTGFGVIGSASDAGGTGVRGVAPALGVEGEASGTSNAVGVAGVALAAGCTTGDSGCRGVQGIAAKGYGVEGIVNGSGVAVHAWSQANGVALKATGQGSGNLIEAWHGPLFPDRKFYVADNGNVFADGTFNPGGADFAEMLPALDGLEPGDVLIIGPDGKLARSTRPYETTLAGVCSTKPGVLGGAEDGTTLVGKVPLAVVGVVPVKVTAEGGPIHAGDALTSSSVPGHAMKAKAVTIGDLTFFPSGVIVGKALGTLESGTGTIQVLVTMQ